jgi:hypothetical protein
MSRSDWYKLATELQARWPNREIPEESIEIWFGDVSHLPADQVRAGILALYRDGREWCPNGAQILTKVSELDRDEVDHGKAWELMNKALLKHGVSDWIAFYECLPPAVSEAARRMRFEMQGGYLKAEESTIRAQFRDIYKNVVAERKRDDAYAGLPSAGLRGLERGPRQLGSALKRALPAIAAAEGER